MKMIGYKINLTKSTSIINIIVIKELIDIVFVLTCVTVVRLVREKVGGLSLMSKMSMLTIAVEDIDGIPPSVARIVSEYLGI